MKKENGLIQCSKNELEKEKPIDVKKIDDDDFEVMVSSNVVTHHKVKVTDLAY